MITKADLDTWLNDLDADATIAIDDGGLTLVAFSADGESFRSLDVGGIPEDHPGYSG